MSLCLYRTNSFNRQLQAEAKELRDSREGQEGGGCRGGAAHPRHSLRGQVLPALAVRHTRHSQVGTKSSEPHKPIFVLRSLVGFDNNFFLLIIKGFL